MRMLQSRRELNLPAESVDVDSGCEIGRKNFYDDLPIKLNLSCDKDARHPRAAELTIDSICAPENFLELILKVGSHGPEYGIVFPSVLHKN